jgi:uncharacterized protein YbjQ (UPF0145 family)
VIKILMVNTDSISGKKITETLGIVRGNSVRAKWFGADIGAALKNIVGGELNQYMHLMEDAREKAIERMIEDAKKLNADGIVNIRFATSQISQGAAEILVYGTAVKLTENK